MQPPPPFHPGEVRAQQRLGSGREAADRGARLIRGALGLDEADFLGELAFVVASARDGAGRPWATLLAGEPGFLRSPDPHTLRVLSRPVAGDPLETAFRPGNDVGLLALDTQGRRRLRVNGRVASGARGFELHVEQVFPNCRRFVRQRALALVRGGSASEASRFISFAEPSARWISHADTLFLATGYGHSDFDSRRGMDVSHRGGVPGFVHVDHEAQLSFPDYSGNGLFSSIGNLLMDPRAGLLFVDFVSGRLVQLTGRITMDGSPELHAARDNRRRLCFGLHKGVARKGLPLVERRLDGKTLCPNSVVSRNRSSNR